MVVTHRGNPACTESGLSVGFTLFIAHQAARASCAPPEILCIRCTGRKPYEGLNIVGVEVLGTTVAGLSVLRGTQARVVPVAWAHRGSFGSRENSEDWGSALLK